MNGPPKYYRPTIPGIQQLIAGFMEQLYVPASVYRLQFNRDFPFTQAAEIVSYLQELGIAAVYSSPFFQAVPGSPHGYNVTDPRRINPEIGSEADFEAFCRLLQQHGLEQIADVVPNHMGIQGESNRLWQDVLENGPASVYAGFFDIDWDPVQIQLENKVLIPVLGDQFGRVLEKGEIRIVYRSQGFFVQYWEHLLPLEPRSYRLILEEAAAVLQQQTGADAPPLLELLSISTAFRNLPEITEQEPNELQVRNREKEIAKRRLSDLLGQVPEAADAVAGVLELLNGNPSDPGSFDRLEDLLNRQCFRLAYWRVAAEEINYRRFFDINELAAIRIEEDQVFDYYHSLLFRLLQEKKVRGLRIDHTDGLYNPPRYFRKLQEGYLRTLTVSALEQSYGPLLDEDLALIDRVLAMQDFSSRLPLFVVIEKILDRKEQLPESWPVSGTVGYDFLNALNGLFIYRGSEKAFDEIYFKFTGMHVEYEELLYLKKYQFARVQMPGEINTLGLRLKKISERNRNYRDFTLNALIRAIRGVIASFPVYRTYISPDATSISERDEQYIHIAVEKAKRRNDSLSPLIYDFIRDILLLQLDWELGEEEKQLYRDFILRFQQITSPIMAKGEEDTVFYVNNRFISLNEVGSDAGYFGYSPGEFHRQNLERNRHWPNSFITTSTHDTKRSEDVRMRLNVLSEIPEEWKTHIVRWARVNKKYKTMLDGELQPKRNTEYFIYQTLVGVWPDYPMEDEYYNSVFISRVCAYVEKAVREAKIFTSWLSPQREYEDAVRSFTVSILQRRKGNYFLKSFLPFQQKIAAIAMYNSLSAQTLKIGSPGVPDFYQGCELWDYSLVDPDNRRPVNYSLRQHLLGRVQGLMGEPGPFAAKSEELLRERRDSRIKIFNLWRGLHFRRSFSDLFCGGEYLPLEIEGELSEHAVAFLRRTQDRFALVVAGRFFFRLLNEEEQLPVGPEVWRDSRVLLPADLDASCLYDIYTRQPVPVERLSEPAVSALRLADIFAYFSFAILTGDELSGETGVAGGAV